MKSQKKINKKSKQEGILIPKKAMIGIAPAIAIIAVLLSKREVGPMFLFLIGIVVGILIAKGFYSKWNTRYIN